MQDTSFEISEETSSEIVGQNKLASRFLLKPSPSPLVRYTHLVHHHHLRSSKYNRSRQAKNSKKLLKPPSSPRPRPPWPPPCLRSFFARDFSLRASCCSFSAFCFVYSCLSLWMASMISVGGALRGPPWVANVLQICQNVLISTRLNTTLNTPLKNLLRFWCLNQYFSVLVLAHYFSILFSSVFAHLCFSVLMLVLVPVENLKIKEIRPTRLFLYTLPLALT